VDYLLVAIQVLDKRVALVVVVVVLVAVILLLEELETKVASLQWKVIQVAPVIFTLLELAVAAAQAALVWLVQLLVAVLVALVLLHQ
jgi:hypothetical protein